MDSPTPRKQLLFQEMSGLWGTHKYHEIEIIISQRGHFGKSRLTIKEDSVVDHRDIITPSHR